MSNSDEVALSPIAPSSRDVAAGTSSLPSAPADQSLAVRASAPPSPPKTEVAKVRARHLKQPKDSKVYKVAMAYVALRAQGFKLAEISEQIGVPKDTIQTYVKRANARGWLNLNSFEDPEDQIDVVLKSKVVRNVNTFLDANDKEVTIEAAKGLGVFKNHQAVKVDGTVGVGFALRVQVELPKNAEMSSPVKIRPGSVGGMPAMDAELIEEAE